jgi:phosphoribosyl-AMP cyclohydrolase
MRDNGLVSSIPAEITSRLERGELIAAIAQSADDLQVLMLAWMNREALERTIQTKRATYWSRSRNTLWVKGEESGNIQEVVSISYDCDGDALLLSVHQHGAACHTGSHSCFAHQL